MNEKLPQAAAHDCWATTASKSPGATKERGTLASSRGVPSARAERIARVGTVLSAIMASSCCWLPPLLLVMGVSGAGMTRALETYRVPFMVITFGFLAAAFYLTYRPRRAAGGNGQGDDCCAAVPVAGRRRFNMMAMNKVMLWAVTAMAIVFLFFPQYVTGLFSSGGEITADMDRTVFVIEGMTCKGWEAKAISAIKTAPGVLAVEVNYETGRAEIGTRAGSSVSPDDVAAALDAIGYRGRPLAE